MTFSFPKKGHRKNRALAAHFLDIIFGGSHTVHIGRGRRRRDFFSHSGIIGACWSLFLPLCPISLFFRRRKKTTAATNHPPPTHLFPFPTLCPVAAAVLSAANCRSSESEVEGDSTKLAKKRKTNSLRETIGEFNPSKKKPRANGGFPLYPPFFCVVTA